MEAAKKVGAPGRGPAPDPALVAGRYRLGELIGEGASSEVFRARDCETGVDRAFKLYREAPGARFEALGRELRPLLALSHRSIVAAHDFGRLDAGPHAGRAYLVMDLCEGGRLEALSNLPGDDERLARWIAVARELADAVAYLHGRRLRHGDISAANVRLTPEGRAVLIDFGLAQAELAGRPAGAPASGTLGYAAPEVLVGEPCYASDLFSLGATLFAAWAGAPPFGLGLEAVRRMQQGPAPRLAEVRSGLPRVWDQLVARLLAPEPEARPASARDLLREIRQAIEGEEAPLVLELGVPFPAGDPLAGIFVGREGPRQALRAHLERLRDGHATTAVVAIEGPAGWGRRALIERVLREVRLASLGEAEGGFDVEPVDLAVVLAAEGERGEKQRGEGQSVQAQASPAGDPSALGVLAALASRWQQRARARPLCVVVAPGRDVEALARFLGAEEPSGRLLVLIPVERSLAHPGVEALVLPPLGEHDIARLMIRAAGDEALDVTAPAAAIRRASGGHPATAAQLVRGWLDAVRAGDAARFDPADAGSAVGALIDARFVRLPAEARRLVVALALATDGAAAAALARLDGEASARAAEAAEAEGFCRGRAGAGLALASDLHRAAVLRHLRALDVLPIAETALPGLPRADRRRAEVLAALRRPREAAAAYREAGHAALAGGRPGAAIDCLRQADGLDDASAALPDRLALASALSAAGELEPAQAVLAGVASEGLSAADAAALAERRAWLLGRQGQAARAREVLEAALARQGPAAASGAGAAAMVMLRARLARVLVSLGQSDQAIQVAAGVPRDGASPGWFVAREAMALAQAYAGRFGEARATTGELLAAAQSLAPPDQAVLGRAHYLRGLVAQLEGRTAEAAGAYSAATAGLEAAGDRQGLAAATFNLGCVLADAGDHGGALPALERAVRQLDQVGAESDRTLALFNVGLLLLRLGELGGAERALARLRRIDAGKQIPLRDPCAACLEADIARRGGERERALRLYAAAQEGFAAHGNLPLALAAALGRVEALAESGQRAEARAELEARTAEGGAGPLAEPLALTRGRLLLLAPASEPGAEARAGEALAALGDRAHGQGRAAAGWRASLLAARLFARARDPRHAGERDKARQRFEEVKMRTPERFHRGLEEDPDARGLWDGAGTGALGSPEALRALAARAERAEGRLRRFARINKRLNSELRLSRVLETIIDTIIELTDAERGFLLLKDDSGEFAVKVARNIDESSLEGPEFMFSRSIARQVADTGQPVITIDAAGDERFREAASVGDLRLRSVLAAPLSVKGKAVGVIYVDHRLRRGAFTDEDVALALDFAEQGAIVIENARLVSELRRRERQVEALNSRLQTELAARHEELAEIRQEMKESREAMALRYDYRQLVGRSPRMMELLRLLDRVTDTALPVVIQGESGTGKELVARALHYNGPRRERPFVSENCAAIPESLLESTLFGYVRGAFTGAERDTRGLFSVANGGTLFLDEVGEMSPAMQGKLLRVLQDGEFRRVGGERPEKVDVRIVVATNKDLARMVEERKFRQDLFYRVSVARIELPPLRDRQEDIPLLVSHFLEKLAAGAGGKPKEIDPAALARLQAYRWPGNVRELENEITRAGAFAGARIAVGDLSPRIAHGAEEAVVDVAAADDVRIRPRVERLERALIREALARFQGNQTRAAAALGLSRFGLQKKLQRYRLTP
jgi:transcriptional regulator with GAF, ATPase, and Fis domain